MTRFWWVRHGPTHEKVLTGWRDVAADLSDAGQIARLDALLPKGAILVSSDLQRAVTTADILGVGRNRLPHDARLREINFGDWDGRHFSDVADTDPELSRAFWERPGDVRAPGGESWNDAAGRAAQTVTELLAAHFGRDIVVVAHFGLILTQLQRALGITATEVLAQKIEPLSVTRLDGAGDHWNAALINYIP